MRLRWWTLTFVLWFAICLAIPNPYWIPIYVVGFAIWMWRVCVWYNKKFPDKELDQSTEATIM